METNKYHLSREFGEKWIYALRNKLYVQIQGDYINHIPFCYCSIGLAAHVNNVPIYNKQIIFGINKFIPFAVKEKVVNMNDDGKSFSEIADWLEANVQLI